MVTIGLDVPQALHARKHPGISGGSSLLALARQGLPYLTSASGSARPPITIYWNVNSVCNLHCKMCDVGTFNEDSNFYKNLRIDRKLHEITLEKFRDVVDEVAEYRPTMAINGTEPIMYKPLGAVTEYARSKGLVVAVTTGGYNLPERAEELAAAGLTRPPDAHRWAPDLHNYIRGRKDAFQRATDGIRNFRRGGARAGLRTGDPALLDDHEHQSRAPRGLTTRCATRRQTDQLHEHELREPGDGANAQSQMGQEVHRDRQLPERRGAAERGRHRRPVGTDPARAGAR
jgi:hypothetical protein